MYIILFIEKLKYFNALDRFAPADVVDRFVTFLIPGFFIFLFTMSTCVTYYRKPLTCVLIGQPTGNNVQDYVNDYCWIHGTINTNVENIRQDNMTAWRELNKTSRHAYYQWMPFVYTLMAILFTLNHTVWKAIVYNRLGVDYEMIVDECEFAAKQKPLGYQSIIHKKVKSAALYLDDVLTFTKRRLKFKGYYKISPIQLSISTFLFNGGVNRVIMSGYLFYKFMLVIVHLVALQILTKLTSTSETNMFTTYTHNLLWNFFSNKDWRDTGLFPILTYCHYYIKTHSGVTNYLAQCQIPINMIHAKIFLFLMPILVISLTATVISIVSWIYNQLWYNRRKGFIKHLLVKSLYAGINDQLDEFDEMERKKKEKKEKEKEKKKKEKEEAEAKKKNEEERKKKIAEAKKEAEKNEINDACSTTTDISSGPSTASTLPMEGRLIEFDDKTDLSPSAPPVKQIYPEIDDNVIKVADDEIKKDNNNKEKEEIVSAENVEKKVMANIAAEDDEITKAKAIIGKQKAKKAIKIKSNQELWNKMTEHCDTFVKNYLRVDGVFIIRMVTKNCGTMVASELVLHLFKYHFDKYLERQKKEAEAMAEEELTKVPEEVANVPVEKVEKIEDTFV